MTTPPIVHPTICRRIAAIYVTTHAEVQQHLMVTGVAPLVADPQLAEIVYATLGSRPPLSRSGWFYDMAASEARAANVATDAVHWASKVLLGDKLELYPRDEVRASTVLAGTPDQIAATLAAAELAAVTAIGRDVGTRLGVPRALSLDVFFSSMEALPLSDQGRILHTLHGDAGTSFGDQFSAAAAAARSNSENLYGKKYPLMSSPSSEVPAWARLSALDALGAFVGGSAHTCSHKLDPRRPQPILAAAWMPGLVTCAACTDFFAGIDDEADATCDGCGHLCTGTEVGDGIRPMSLTLGYLTFMLGLCERCYLEWPSQASA